MEGLYKGFEIIKNHFHTSNQQRQKSNRSPIEVKTIIAYKL
ncbi:hypothetical protein ANA_C13303 [Anabaena sp. 90]|nr:hypothetical protein ANA_C13303 [Anabaena sp. 90]